LTIQRAIAGFCAGKADENSRRENARLSVRRDFSGCPYYFSEAKIWKKVQW
jgi:hypothetical protein